jgi:2-methylisocitrate lyase-like PEP mutase family enzyme
MDHFKSFLQLHQNPAPFILGNIWDAGSAKTFESNGYQAIGTSSQALSNAMGYEDGENIPFETLLQFSKRVIESVNIPFSVDVEGGYSRNIDGIIENISKLHDVGVVGINLEDTVPGPPRTLQSVQDFQLVISQVANYMSQNNLHLFLNIRTDGFLLGLPNALTETLTRATSYENAGANGIFTPCISNPDDIKQVVNATSLPVNVMCIPNLPDFATLETLGVKRISMGPFLFNKAYENVGKLLQSIKTDNNFSSILS